MYRAWLINTNKYKGVLSVAYEYTIDVFCVQLFFVQIKIRFRY